MGSSNKDNFLLVLHTDATANLPWLFYLVIFRDEDWDSYAIKKNFFFSSAVPNLKVTFSIIEYLSDFND